MEILFAVLILGGLGLAFGEILKNIFGNLYSKHRFIKVEAIGDHLDFINKAFFYRNNKSSFSSLFV